MCRIIRVIGLLETVYAAVESSELTSKKHDGKSMTEKTCQKWKKSYSWLEIVDFGGTENFEMCILHPVCATEANKQLFYSIIFYNLFHPI